MRILRVISSLNPADGGPAAALRAITPELKERGCESEVVCLDEGSETFLGEFPARVHPVGGAKTSYRWSLGLKPWLKENVSRFDAVVVHGLWQYHGFCTRRVCAQVPKKYFVYPHGMLDPWFKRRYPLKHLKKWLYWPFGEYRILRDAAAVMFTTEEERKLARESFWLYRCHERVVNYGTAAPPDRAEIQRRAFYDQFPAFRERPFLLFLGRIHEKKGCDLLIEAYVKWRCATLSAGDRGPELIIAGPCVESGYLGSLKDKVRKLGAEVVDGNASSSVSLDGLRSVRVHFLPMLSGDVKWGAFRCAEAFVLPSHQENFGVAVAEALACGTPVLISNKVNIWREIETDGAGLVGDDTVEGCLSLLKRWDPAPESMNIVRARARKCFETRFEISAAADCLLQCMKRELSGEIRER